VLRLPGSLPAAACAAAFVGCGGGNDPAERLDDTLGYFPANAGVVAVARADLDDEQFERFDRRFVRPDVQGGLEGLLKAFAADQGLSYEDDIEPLLGGELVVGTQSDEGLLAEGDPELVGALRVPDPEDLRRLLEKLGLEEAGEAHGADLYEGFDFVHVALEGDVLVVARTPETLERALAGRDDGDRMTAARFDEALEGLPEDALLRIYGDPRGLLRRDDVAGLAQLPWFSALRSFGAAVSFGEEEIALDAVANTEADVLDEDDLPLATGSESPEVVPSDTQIAGGNLDQSRTTVFLLRAAEAAFADSRFVRDVRELEEELGIDFEEEILRQFDGPSASLLTPDGRGFAARSEVRDPERLRAHLSELAPVLPRLIQDLEGLSSQGLALLLLFAPDAPALPTALAEVRVEAPSGADDLYRVTGLTGDGPSELYFGLVGDVFVVGSQEQEALDMADAETSPVAGAEGAAVTRLDVTAARDRVPSLFGLDTGALGELVTSVEASVDELRARVRIEWKEQE
jgi:hypothetical protein